MQDHIHFDGQSLHLLDQRLLPHTREYVVCRTSADTVEAIANMTVRGAPAIGIAGAFACVLAARELMEKSGPEWLPEMESKLTAIAQARPTAVNLAWAVERMKGLLRPGMGLTELLDRWTAEAKDIHARDIADNKAMGAFGAEIIPDNATVMTHCNAGALATGGYGTALGVIRAAFAAGKNIKVIANETRPWLQGARLTAYELHEDGIPVTLAPDNSAALLMAKGLVDVVVTGADRIAANGDSANKIGTYGLALLARAHNIPFYIAAPLSTIDRQAPDGSVIPIEERPQEEVTGFGGRLVSPAGVPAYNFSFDVTPAGLISGIITEKGILRPPYDQSIAKAFGT